MLVEQHPKKDRQRLGVQELVGAAPVRRVAGNRALVEATDDAVGRRPRTIYSITPSGRRALKEWLDQPGDGPVVEFDALLRVFFAEHSTRSGVEANITAIKEWAAEQNAVNVAFARLYTETGGPFPERLPAIVLTGKFLTDFADMVDRWATWAASVVDTWPEDPAAAEPDWETLHEVARREVDRRGLPEL